VSVWRHFQGAATTLRSRRPCRAKVSDTVLPSRSSPEMEGSAGFQFA
jgi:hypothetical protein